MTTVHILIMAILMMGGAISTLGDYLEKKIRKERLSLFNLRPKHTISLVAMLTGMSISASTLFVMFVAHRDLREAVFEQQIETEIQSQQEELKIVSEFQSKIDKIDEI
ncbi:MAG: DUF3084 domain-containing protein [Nostocales cyanobacterium 94392]|nr:DUF3084 domain-containing protein [Nostocales cyanobacterium 94392]